MISVVMLVRDRLELTKQAIKSLTQNTKGRFRLTVVDDSSQPETRDWLMQIIGKHTHWAKLIRNEESKGTGWARNQGVQAALEKFGMSNLLYLSDNDVWFAPGWDEVLLKAHEAFPRYKIIGGGCHPFLKPIQQPRGLGASRFVANGGLYKVEARDAVSGYSWLLSWDTWERYGPLDAHALGVRQSEDFAMCRKVVEAGHFVGAINPEVVLHTGIYKDTFGDIPPGSDVMAQNKREGILYE